MCRAIITQTVGLMASQAMNEENENDYEFEKSKSQIKRDLLALQELGRQLVDLPARDLKKIPVSETVLEAISDAHRFKHGALKRQLQFLGGLMREEDSAAIQLALDGLTQPKREAVRLMHQIEAWRDSLLAGDDEVLNQLVGDLNADRQYLRQLVRNAAREKEHNKPPKSARVLFQYLQELQQQS